MTSTQNLRWAAIAFACGAAVIFMFNTQSYDSYGPVFVLLTLTVMLLSEHFAPRSAASKTQSFAYFWSLFCVVFIANSALNLPAPSWYPTDHSFWIFAPLVLFAIATVALEKRRKRAGGHPS